MMISHWTNHSIDKKGIKKEKKRSIGKCHSAAQAFTEHTYVKAVSIHKSITNENYDEKEMVLKYQHIVFIF